MNTAAQIQIDNNNNKIKTLHARLSHMDDNYTEGSEEHMEVERVCAALAYYYQRNKAIRNYQIAP